MPKKPKRGRPPISLTLRREKIPIRLPRWLIDWLDTRTEGRAALIEEAIKARHRLTAP